MYARAVVPEQNRSITCSPTTLPTPQFVRLRPSFPAASWSKLSVPEDKLLNLDAYLSYLCTRVWALYGLGGDKVLPSESYTTAAVAEQYNQSLGCVNGMSSEDSDASTV
jgi:hypothetical protein